MLFAHRCEHQTSNPGGQGFESLPAASDFRAKNYRFLRFLQGTAGSVRANSRPMPKDRIAGSDPSPSAKTFEKYLEGFGYF
jgi:hypothetical protein